jgi:hypothetical protein
VDLRQLQRFENVSLDVQGETDAKRAESLVSAMSEAALE